MLASSFVPLSNWVLGMIKEGLNFLAWREDRVVGHAALFPDYKKNDAEYLVFVSQAHRGLGLGSGLTRLSLERARELGLAVLWLTVETYNFRAVNLFKKFGFRFSDRSLTERTMILSL